MRRRWYVGVGELDGPLGAAGHRRGRRQQPVVRPDQHPLAPGHLDRDGAPLGADARVDHGEHDAARQVLDGAHQRQRAGPHVVGRDLVGEVDAR